MNSTDQIIQNNLYIFAKYYLSSAFVTRWTPALKRAALLLALIMVLAMAYHLTASIHPQGFLIGGHVIFFVILLARLYMANSVIAIRIKKVFGGLR